MSDSAGQTYLFNTHGDVVKLIGTLTWSYTYDAYGVQQNPDPIDTNAFRYAGQYFDTESGTYYLRARYYNPATGRFTQQDAWTNANRNDPIGLNLYLYCNGNPVRYFDFGGESPVFVLRLFSLMYNANIVTSQEISYLLIYENGLNIGNAMHEIAQVNVARYLSQMGFETMLETRIKRKEIDITSGDYAWEVKPIGETGAEQLDGYCSLGGYVPGFDIEPIYNIPIVGNYKMGVVSSSYPLEMDIDLLEDKRLLAESGVINYFFYKEDNGKKVQVSSAEVYTAVVAYKLLNAFVTDLLEAGAALMFATGIGALTSIGGALVALPAVGLVP